MIVDVVVPPAGESIQEGMLVEWAAAEGAVVRAEEPLFVLETDKVTLTVNAPQSGRLALLVPAGEMVKIGQKVATLDTAAAGEESPAETLHITAPAGLPQMRDKLSDNSLEALSPSVRRLVEENRLDPGAVSPTGKDGRLTKEDVVQHLKGAAGTAEGRGQASQVGSAPKAAPPAPGAAATRRPLSPIRQRIAERMLQSQQTTATLTTFNEADLSALMDLRKRYREAFKAKHGVDLGFLPFFVKAAAEALRAVPALRTTIEGAELVTHEAYHIGIAVAADHGLAVPVLRDADRKGLAEIQRDIESLARKVRERSIALTELQGGVFSITNAGSYGALMGTPILNPPQAGILGMYTIQDRPVARDGQMVIRPMMYLALSYDHRVVDGKEAGTFLKRIAECVETPARFLLELE